MSIAKPYNSPWIMLITVIFLSGFCNVSAAESLTYPIVDTGQDRCFSNDKEIKYPKSSNSFYGQDAQYSGLQPSYKNNNDGTVTDKNTGLMWVKSPDLKNKISYREAAAGAAECRVGGYADWRLPTIKELYSLIDFRGYSTRTVNTSKPYIDTRYFDFVYGNEYSDDRLIDSQFWSATEYTGLTMDGNFTVFGVNFADGRIKGYPAKAKRGREKKSFVRYVRGNREYGKNKFIDNGDGTVTDQATGLTWTKSDSGKTMNWQQALQYAQKLSLAGHNDWRLPNAKELQSIVDYTHSLAAEEKSVRGASIDKIFELTDTQSWFWTSTTHLENKSCGFAVYICFGQAWGQMHGQKMDVHGSGAQRSDPKAGNPSNWSSGNGPQGDEVRIYNYVRCVRGGDVVNIEKGPAISGAFSASRKGSDSAPAGGGFVSRLDKNGDGKVSKSEFDGPSNHFSVLDKNHDGYLSEDEAPQHPPSGNRPKRW